MLTKLVPNMAKNVSDSEYSRSEEETDSEVEKEKVSKKEKCKKGRVSSRPQKEKDNKPQSKTVNSSRKRKSAFEDVDFDDLSVDIDLSSDNISHQRIKLASNLLLESRIVEVKEDNGKKYSYPALVFIRRVKDKKVFEFNVPTVLSSKLCEAIRTLVRG